VGFDFVSLPKWAAFVKSLQNEKVRTLSTCSICNGLIAHFVSQQDGGFYTGVDKKTVTLESTAHAIATLRLLQQTKLNTEQFVDLVNGEALASFVVPIPRDVRSAAQAHLAVALTKVFSRNFETRVYYEVRPIIITIINQSFPGPKFNMRIVGYTIAPPR
jgi:hypothetical protein